MNLQNALIEMINGKRLMHNDFINEGGCFTFVKDEMRFIHTFVSLQKERVETKVYAIDCLPKDGWYLFKQTFTKIMTFYANEKEMNILTSLENGRITLKSKQCFDFPVKIRVEFEYTKEG